MNINRKVCFTSLVLGLSLVASHLRAQDGQTLSWKFEKGSAFEVELTQISKIESTVDSRMRKIDNRLSLKMNWSVEEVNPDGHGTIKQSIQAIKIVTNSAAGGGVDIDTENVEAKKGVDAQLMKQILSLVDTEFSVEFSPRGELVSVMLPEATKEKLRGLPGSMQIRQLLTSEGIQKLYGQSAIVFPANTIEKGHAWTKESQVETALGNFTRTDTYEIAQLGPTEATIDVTTTLGERTGEKVSETEMTGFTGSGKIQFNVAEGFIVESSFANEMQTERPYREKSIATTVDSQVEMTWKRIAKTNGE